MSKKSLVDSITVKTPCAENWSAMKGDETVRFCGHCNLNVNNISTMTRKQAFRLVRESNGRLCVRYIVNPVNHQPIFADKLYQIGRRVPRIAAATMAATLSLSSIAYAQGGVSFGEVLNKSESAQSQKKKKSPDQTAGISGTITDPQGAVIPNIIVTLTNTETNQSQTCTSNEDGFYEFQNTAAGIYDVTAEADSGFAAARFENLVVSEGKNFRRDIEMGIAGEMLLSGVVLITEYDNPLHRAVSNDDAEETGNLITNGADVNSKDENYNKITPLFLAVENGNVEIAEILLNFGAKINSRDEQRQTPLMRLDADASAEFAALLIRHGARIKATDEEKNTPLILAARNAKPEVLEVLIKHGAQIDAQNGNGESALMIAAGADNLENVRFLLIAGAEIDLKDKKGGAAIDYASEEEVEKLLESYGAKTRDSSAGDETADESKPDDQ